MQFKMINGEMKRSYENVLLLTQFKNRTGKNKETYNFATCYLSITSQN